MKIYDSDIRDLLTKKFLNTKCYTSDPTTTIIHEMDVLSGTSRVDIAVVNGQLHGYEIKSECDTLERLPAQIEAYNLIFDTLTIVAGENHVPKILDIAPNWWGVYSVIKDEKKASLKRMRQPKKNKEVNPFYISQLLWKAELVELLNNHGITKGLKSKTRFALGQKVVEKIPDQVIKNFVRLKLKSREDWKAVQLQQIYDDLQ